MSAPGQQISLASATPPFFAGIDIGGTNIKIGIVDDTGQTLGQDSLPTTPEQGFHAALERLKATYAKLLAAIGLKPLDIAHIGVGIPGMISVKKGMLFAAHNLPTWDNTPVAPLIAEALQRPCNWPMMPMQLRLVNTGSVLVRITIAWFWSRSEQVLAVESSSKIKS